MRTVVGLGNPGARYRNTRHNAGFVLVDGIADGSLILRAALTCAKPMKSLGRLFGKKDSFLRSSGPYVSLEGELDGTAFLLVKPTTFMNDSGRCIAHLTRKGVIRDIDELLVIVDDVNIDLGTLRFREKGSSGGQKGLQSIMESLGTTEFARLRIGVGPKPEGRDLRDFVLGGFTPKERKLFEDTVSRAADVVEGWIENGARGAQDTVSRLQSQQ